MPSVNPVSACLPASLGAALAVLVVAFTPGCAVGSGDDGGITTFGSQTSTFTTFPATATAPMEEDTDDEAGDGDPTSGDGDPGTAEGDGDPSTCGNGQLDAGETCDGFDLDGESCATLGYTGGALACTDDCLDFDVSGCENDLCGNGVIDAGELCDGVALMGQTCMGLGFAGGTLACGGNCLTYDTSQCVEAQCGNGVIEAGEVCDGGSLGGETCVTQGFAGGSLSCNVNCASYNTGGCFNDDGDCCVAHGYTGCQDAGITNCVCALDPYCCDTEWDDLCVEEAINDCGAIC